MFVVLCSAFDEEAALFVDRWPAEVSLLVPSDLSRPGWNFDPEDIAHSTAIIGGRQVSYPGIDGVFTLLPRVFEQELYNIVDNDRRYVAFEMTAVLLAWLTALSIPVINRPHPGCLSGPSWAPARWRHEAAACGIPINGAPPQSNRTFWATVIGGKCISEADDQMAAAARCLAEKAGVDILSVQFDSPRPDASFLSASFRPDLRHPALIPALEGLFQKRSL